MRTRRLALCAMLCALGDCFLWIGSALDFLDLTVVCAASFFCVFAVIELGAKSAWAIYAVTGLLAILIVPIKFTAVEYIVIAGVYPILKYYFERRLHRPVLLWAVKLLYAAAVIAVLLFFARLLLLTAEPLPMVLLTAAMGMAAFVLYDIALTRIISLYYYRWRKRLRIGRWLK